MYMHMVEQWDTTMNMQQQPDLKAVRKWVGCTDSIPELLATELVIRQYRWRSSLDLYKYKAQKSKICEVAGFYINCGPL